VQEDVIRQVLGSRVPEKPTLSAALRGAGGDPTRDPRPEPRPDPSRAEAAGSGQRATARTLLYPGIPHHHHHHHHIIHHLHLSLPPPHRIYLLSASGLTEAPPPP